MKPILTLILLALSIGAHATDTAQNELTPEARQTASLSAMEMAFCSGVIEVFASAPGGTDADYTMVMGHSRGYYMAANTIFQILSTDLEKAKFASDNRKGTGLDWAKSLDLSDNLESQLLVNRVFKCFESQPMVADIVQNRLAQLYAE